MMFATKFFFVRSKCCCIAVLRTSTPGEQGMWIWSTRLGDISDSVAETVLNAPKLACFWHFDGIRQVFDYFCTLRNKNLICFEERSNYEGGYAYLEARRIWMLSISKFHLSPKWRGFRGRGEGRAGERLVLPFNFHVLLFLKDDPPIRLVLLRSHALYNHQILAQHSEEGGGVLKAHTLHPNKTTR